MRRSLQDGPDIRVSIEDVAWAMRAKRRAIEQLFRTFVAEGLIERRGRGVYRLTRRAGRLLDRATADEAYEMFDPDLLETMTPRLAAAKHLDDRAESPTVAARWFGVTTRRWRAIRRQIEAVDDVAGDAAVGTTETRRNDRDEPVGTSAETRRNVRRNPSERPPARIGPYLARSQAVCAPARKGEDFVEDFVRRVCDRFAIRDPRLRFSIGRESDRIAEAYVATRRLLRVGRWTRDDVMEALLYYFDRRSPESVERFVDDWSINDYVAHPIAEYVGNRRAEAERRAIEREQARRDERLARHNERDDLVGPPAGFADEVGRMFKPIPKGVTDGANDANE